jgi:hypothetical protein
MKKNTLIAICLSCFSSIYGAQTIYVENNTDQTLYHITLHNQSQTYQDTIGTLIPHTHDSYSGYMEIASTDKCVLSWIDYQGSSHTVTNQFKTKAIINTHPDLVFTIQTNNTVTIKKAP